MRSPAMKLAPQMESKMSIWHDIISLFDRTSHEGYHGAHDAASFGRSLPNHADAGFQAVETVAGIVHIVTHTMHDAYHAHSGTSCDPGHACDTSCGYDSSSQH